MKSSLGHVEYFFAHSREAYDRAQSKLSAEASTEFDIRGELHAFEYELTKGLALRATGLPGAERPLVISVRQIKQRADRDTNPVYAEALKRLLQQPIWAKCKDIDSQP